MGWRDDRALPRGFHNVFTCLGPINDDRSQSVRTRIGLQGGDVNRLIQSFLLGSYRLVRKSGVLDEGIGERCFEVAYDLYKGLLEARDIRRLRPFVEPGTTVVDVGANIGFFAVRFAEWTGKAGRVLALEPEAANIRRIRRRVAQRGLDGVIQVVPAAVADRPGTAMLAVDPDHPGNHHLADSGIPVETVSVDGLLADHGWPPVSLIKIDVQGGECGVIAGAAKTLDTLRPALFVEVDPGALAAAGSSAEALFESLERHGYRSHRLDTDGPPSPVSRDAALASFADGPGYEDFLFLYAEGDAG